LILLVVCFFLGGDRSRFLWSPMNAKHRSLPVHEDLVRWVQIYLPSCLSTHPNVVVLVLPRRCFARSSVSADIFKCYRHILRSRGDRLCSDAPANTFPLYILIAIHLPRVACLENRARGGVLATAFLARLSYPFFKSRS
jgi:hypothetical protein